MSSFTFTQEAALNGPKSIQLYVRGKMGLFLLKLALPYSNSFGKNEQFECHYCFIVAASMRL
jgi:hypothetical protein